LLGAALAGLLVKGGGVVVVVKQAFDRLLPVDPRSIKGEESTALGADLADPLAAGQGVEVGAEGDFAKDRKSNRLR
jgi:hypothetical protein